MEQDMNEINHDNLREMPDEKPVERIAGREAYEWLRSCVECVLVIILVFTFAVRMMSVQGPSMRQTLQQGDRLLVVNAPLVTDYRQGDIVIA